MLDPDLVALVHGGVAVGVATRDADRRPAFTRAWGPEVSADGRMLRLCVDAPSGSVTRANLEGNGAVAVGFNPPTVARALQIKGVACSVREPEPEELERAERHFVAFSMEGERVGVSASLLRRAFAAPRDLVSVTLSIDEVFDGTPGTGAGQRV
jgi:Pyridoxamine 5'-phosphate oxidase